MPAIDAPAPAQAALVVASIVPMVKNKPVADNGFYCRLNIFKTLQVRESKEER
jgi:hypothetical protein